MKIPLPFTMDVHGEESAAFAARIWERVIPDGECLIWTGYTRNGYGSIQRRGVNLYTHRLSFELHIGPIPTGLNVCHTCDRRRCIRPSHFFAGTQAENVADMERKGRANKVGARGLANPNATLTDGEVEELRGAVASGLTQREAGRRFNCSQSTVWRLVHRRTRSVASATNHFR